MARKKKSSSAFWWVLGVMAVLVVLLVFLSRAGPDVDFTAYAYTDDEVPDMRGPPLIEEFSDFQCVFCKQITPVMRAVKHDFNVTVEYKHFVLGIFPQSQMIAEAAECARDQNRFWAYHDLVFDNSDHVQRSHLLSYAEGLGLDTTRFRQCLDGREKQATVQADRLEGERRGVRGTPSVFIDGEQVNARTYEDFARLLR
jgi:protein-disulfide isomerase